MSETPVAKWRVWLAYKRVGHEAGYLLGVFTTEEMAQAAAHHPYDGGKVIMVDLNKLYDNALDEVPCG